MTALRVYVAGIGVWSPQLTDFSALRRVLAGAAPGTSPARPPAAMLPPNERRRAPESVAVALEVALEACTAAQRDPATLPSVFASTHGDLSITDYMCSTLLEDPRAMSPTRFHNSVHNAAAGYWTIGNHCVLATTAISAFDATFAQGLLEALLQLASGEPAVLLAAYDSASAGPLAAVSRSEGTLGGALVLSSAGHVGKPRLRVTLVDGNVAPARGALARLAAGNAMAPMLPLFDALALGDDAALLKAGPGRVLRVEIAHG